MDEALQFVAQHGYAVLALWVFGEQIGLPVPSIPILLAAGVLAGSGQMHAGGAMVLATGASLLADLVWFELGRRRGMSILSLLCRLALETDACVRKTASAFYRHDALSLLVAKFVPGLNTLAPPMAGVLRMNWGRFLLYDGLGSLLWVAPFIGLGMLFSEDVTRIEARFRRASTVFGWLLLGSVAAYAGWKLFQRRRSRRLLQGERITAADLKARLDAGAGVTVVDVRHPLELERDAGRIPGALHIPLEELPSRWRELPANDEVVLYCNCPNDVSAARAARMLRENGLPRARALAGGFDGWRRHGFPVDSIPKRPD